METWEISLWLWLYAQTWSFWISLSLPNLIFRSPKDQWKHHPLILHHFSTKKKNTALATLESQIPHPLRGARCSGQDGFEPSYPIEKNTCSVKWVHLPCENEQKNWNHHLDRCFFLLDSNNKFLNLYLLYNVWLWLQPIWVKESCILILGYTIELRIGNH